MWTLVARKAAAAAFTGLALSGCGGDAVLNPITPEQARAEVINAARDIVAILHADVAEATFSYESCNDQGDPPFRGVVDLSLWMPGIAHDQPADPKTVLQPLTAHGWSTDSDFVSHSPTFRKDKINVIVTIPPQPPAGITLGDHVGVNIDGQCRDTFDHRKDRSILPVNVSKELQP